MKTATCLYYLDGIKYFHPDVRLKLTCPKCKAEDTLDLYDYGIEYPEPKEILTVECIICGDLLKVEMNIKLTAEINYQILE